jgi:hypothetical protein
MKHSIAIMVGVAVIAASITGPALSQGTPQTVTIMKVDPPSLTTGYRTSKVKWAAASSTKRMIPSAQSTI